MVRRLAVVIALALVLAVARDASAIPVTQVEDLDSWVADVFLVRSHTDLFTVSEPPPLTMGEIFSEVFFDPLTSYYTYVHTVTPALDDNVIFQTLFQVHGNPGIAGWSFSDALRAGGEGNADDFPVVNMEIDFVNDNSGRLAWISNNDRNWDAREPIAFFFVSNLPPRAVTEAYRLLGGTGRREVGFAQGLAPVPEPGSIMLLGSGLLGLYAHMRRRRHQKADPV